MGSIYSELPRWQSHKIVKAAPILDIEQRAADLWRVTLDLGTAPGASSPSTLDTDLHRDGTAAKQPAVGDYFVLYDDSHRSWSPRGAFHAGYTRVVKAVDPRGTGRTTEAMRAAPSGAFYVWCDANRDYAHRLSEKLGRSDLGVIAPESVEMVLQGQAALVVVDHDARLTEAQWIAVTMCRAKVPHG